MTAFLMRLLKLNYQHMKLRILKLQLLLLVLPTLPRAAVKVDLCTTAKVHRAIGSERLGIITHGERCPRCIWLTWLVDLSTTIAVDLR